MQAWMFRGIMVSVLIALACLPAFAQQISDTLGSASSRSVDLAQTGRVTINLDIVTSCAGGVATFKISNVGEAWPRLGTVNVVRIGDGESRIVQRRQMRFAADQKASFRLKDADTDEIALYVQPSWYDRQPQVDSRITCP